VQPNEPADGCKRLDDSLHTHLAFHDHCHAHHGVIHGMRLPYRRTLTAPPRGVIVILSMLLPRATAYSQGNCFTAVKFAGTYSTAFLVRTVLVFLGTGGRSAAVPSAEKYDIISDQTRQQRPPSHQCGLRRHAVVVRSS
jgi:hypothetical protein